jgi:hypothetical protein
MDKLVGAVDGEFEAPISPKPPVVSHIDAAWAADDAPPKLKEWSMALLVWVGSVAFFWQRRYLEQVGQFLAMYVPDYSELRRTRDA